MPNSVSFVYEFIVYEALKFWIKNKGNRDFFPKMNRCMDDLILFFFFSEKRFDLSYNLLHSVFSVVGLYFVGD